MREESRVEIDTHAVCFGKIDPFLEMLGLKRVAVGKFALFENRVAGVNVDLLLAGNERHSFIHIGKQLFGSSCLARIVTGGLDTAGKRAVMVEADNVVTLPAVHGHRNIL